MKNLIEKYKNIIKENYAAGAVHFYGGAKTDIMPQNDGELNGAFAEILNELLNGAEASKAVEKLYKLLPLYNEKTEPYGNWWYWEIGIPRSVNQIFTLIYDAAPKELLEQYMNAERHFNNEIKLTGANRLWESEIFAVRGILCNRADEFNAAKNGIESLFKWVNEGDGFYKDGSFIQHGCIPYNGGYGLSMLAGLADMLALTGKTDSGEIVKEWIRKSFLPFMYNGIFMDMVRGREISRYYSMSESAYKKAKYFIDRLGEKSPAEDGFCYFEKMDRAVIRRKSFAAGLSMHSKSIANFESINNENMTAWHTADGMLYLYTDPKRFSGSFFPCADMERMPGTTVIRGEYPSANKPSKYGFCTGKSVDCGGVCAMYLAPYGTRLRAKKAWFFLDDIIVCLGTDISKGAETVIENIMLDKNSIVEIEKDFIYVKRGKNDTGVSVISSGAKTVRETRNGGWENISSVTDGKEYSAGFLTIYKEHETDFTYEYILFPGKRVTSNTEITIVSNSSNEQSVKYKDKIYSVHWSKDEVQIL